MNKPYICHAAFLLLLVSGLTRAATTLPDYYAHPAVEDEFGVIAPWYAEQNGQLDFRIRISAETLKRYPWVDTDKAIMAAPYFVFTSTWSIDKDGNIGAPPLSDWACGDLAQRTVSLINGLADYYRYSGDPAAIAFIVLQADYILDYAQTPPDHPWPGFPISVPTKGKPYGKCDPNGFIQLDLCADIGTAILRAYQITGETRYFDAAKHWGDLLAQHCDPTPGKSPWNRYANPEQVKWSNELTGSVAYILRFLDQLVRLDYTGPDNIIVKARDAGRLHLQNVLLPKWTATDTWGRYYWDWECPVISLVNVWAMQYVMDRHEAFPLWKNDVRNVLTLLINRTGVDPKSAAEVYSGAWAIPESPSCCGMSLSYGQQLMAGGLAQYASIAGDRWAREMARRMAIEGSYDALENGTVIDGITGKPIVAADWLNIIHPLAMRTMLQIMAYMPDVFGPSRENHIVRSSAEITNVTYEKGKIAFTTFDAPEQTMTVLRLSFVPSEINSGGTRLMQRRDTAANGYMMNRLGNGDCVITIRHDRLKDIAVAGKDPQTVLDDKDLNFSGNWSVSGTTRISANAGSALTCKFTGNQVRVIGDIDPAGGYADVYLDSIKQLSPIDCWNRKSRDGQVLFSKAGLPQQPHEMRIVVRGAKNPCTAGANVYVDAVQFSDATGMSGFGSGGGSAESQRMVFGYAGREDLHDAAGSPWRPATEWILRLGANADSVGAAWWTEPVKEPIQGTDSPDLYRYGAHAPEFVVNATVAPGKYYAVLKFAVTRNMDPARDLVSVLVNGQPAIDKINIASKSGGPNTAFDVKLNHISPKNGVIEFRFAGGDKEAGTPGEAFIQALEIGTEK